MEFVCWQSFFFPSSAPLGETPPGTTLFQQGSGEVMGNGELWGASSRPAVGFDHEVQGDDDGGNGSAEQCF